jgi:hypothetical protein
MSDNGYDRMTDARIAGEERREWVREGRIRYLRSLKFWRVYDGVRYAYGLLNRSDPLPGFDFADAMGAETEGKTYWGVNAGQIEALAELAEQEGMHDRSTVDEWIAFFEGHRLPGVEIFKRVEAAHTVKSAVEPAPLDDDGSDFQGPSAASAVARANGIRSGEKKAKERNYAGLREMWFGQEWKTVADFWRHAQKMFKIEKETGGTWQVLVGETKQKELIKEWRKEGREPHKTVANS